MEKAPDSETVCSVFIRFGTEIGQCSKTEHLVFSTIQHNQNDHSENTN